LGNGVHNNIFDIVYVKKDTYHPANHADIASTIKGINAALSMEKRRCLYIGPGRWGSSDRWLGIPVSWKDISQAAAIVEYETTQISSEMSQGSHFLYNLVGQGVHYLTIRCDSFSFLRLENVTDYSIISETLDLRHIRVNQPMSLFTDGSTSQSMLLFTRNLDECL
jgi:hypothetical protein